VVDILKRREPEGRSRSDDQGELSPADGEKKKIVDNFHRAEGQRVSLFAFSKLVTPTAMIRAQLP